jgi:hypothetical protein
VATKGSDEPSFYTSPVFIAAVALYLAFRAFVLADYGGSVEPSKRDLPSQELFRQAFSWIALRTILKKRSLELFLCFSIVFVSLCSHYFHANVSQSEIQKAKAESKAASDAIKEQSAKHDQQLKLPQMETDVKIQDLQRQLDHFQQATPRRDAKPK